MTELKSGLWVPGHVAAGKGIRGHQTPRVTVDETGVVRQRGRAGLNPPWYETWSPTVPEGGGVLTVPAQQYFETMWGKRSKFTNQIEGLYAGGRLPWTERTPPFPIGYEPWAAGIPWSVVRHGRLAFEVPVWEERFDYPLVTGGPDFVEIFDTPDTELAHTARIFVAWYPGLPQVRETSEYPAEIEGHPVDSPTTNLPLNKEEYEDFAGLKRWSTDGSIDPASDPRCAAYVEFPYLYRNAIKRMEVGVWLNWFGPGLDRRENFIERRLREVVPIGNLVPKSGDYLFGSWGASSQVMEVPLYEPIPGLRLTEASRGWLVWGFRTTDGLHPPGPHSLRRESRPEWPRVTTTPTYSELQFETQQATSVRAGAQLTGRVPS